MREFVTVIAALVLGGIAVPSAAAVPRQGTATAPKDPPASYYFLLGRHLEDLEKFDFTEEPFDDPLGIAVSWEEKYKKRAKETPAAAGAEPGKMEPA